MEDEALKRKERLKAMRTKATAPKENGSEIEQQTNDDEEKSTIPA